MARRRRHQMSRAEMDYKLARLRIVEPWRGRAMMVLALTVPLGVTTWLLHDFAGKTTTLNISFVVSISIVANAAMGLALRRRQNAMAAQSQELNRLRGRVQELEAQEGTLSGIRAKGQGRRT